MTLNWFRTKRPTVVRELTGRDVDGEILHEIDVVTLLTEVQCDANAGWPNIYLGTIPAGSIGTVILVMPDGQLDLEFNIHGKPAFAHVTAEQVRLRSRAKSHA